LIDRHSGKLDQRGIFSKERLMPLIRSNMLVGGQLAVTGQLNAHSTLVAENGFASSGPVHMGSDNPGDDLFLLMERSPSYQGKLRVLQMADSAYSLDPDDMHDVLYFGLSSYSSASLTMGSNAFYRRCLLLVVNASASDIPLSIPNLSYSGVLSMHTTYEFLGGDPLGGWNLIAKYGNVF
jgi:hypothetical protein